MFCAIIGVIVLLKYNLLLKHRSVHSEFLGFTLLNQKNTKIISFAGRLIPEKGVEILINAFEKCGFEKCGIIHLENGDPRVAYEKVL